MNSLVSNVLFFLNGSEWAECHGLGFVLLTIFTSHNLFLFTSTMSNSTLCWTNSLSYYRSTWGWYYLTILRWLVVRWHETQRSKFEPFVQQSVFYDCSPAVPTSALIGILALYWYPQLFPLLSLMCGTVWQCLLVYYVVGYVLMIVWFVLVSFF